LHKVDNSFIYSHKTIIIFFNKSGFNCRSSVFSCSYQFYNSTINCSQSPGARICISPAICTWGTTYTVSSRTNSYSRFLSWHSRKNLLTFIRWPLVCSILARSLFSWLLSLRTGHSTKCASCLHDCWKSPCQEGRSLLDFHDPQTHSPDLLRSALIPRHDQGSCWLKGYLYSNWQAARELCQSFCASGREEICCPNMKD